MALEKVGTKSEILLKEEEQPKNEVITVTYQGIDKWANPCLKCFVSRSPHC